MHEKDNFHKPIKPEPSSIDWYKQWLDSVKAIEAKPKALEISEEEINREGQEKPVKQIYPSTSKSELIKRELHFRYIAENYDSRTSEKLPNWESESVWLERNKF